MPMTKRPGRPPAKPTAFLRLAMERRGLTTRELAALAGCNPKYLNKLMAGTRFPGRQLAGLLGLVLKIDPAKLLWPDPNGGKEA